MKGFSASQLTVLLWTASLGANLHAASIPTAMENSGEYYYSRQDYAQALPIYQQMLTIQPENISALGRVCEMKLLLEGRNSCFEVLQTRFATPWGKSADGKRVLSDFWDRFSSVFVTDDGQTAYLVGMVRATAHDWGGALPYFDQAASLENGNLKVLRAKMRAEKGLKRYEAVYATLEKINVANPFDFSQWDDWLEALYFRRDFERVIAASKERGDEPNSIRSRIAVAASLVEMNRYNEALPLLQAVVAREKGVVHPIVWYSLGKTFANRPGAMTEAIFSLERFLSVMKKPEAVLIEGWDPFHTEELKDNAQKLLTELKSHGDRLH